MISSLKGNNTLEKLELEGNTLGPKTAKALGLLLRTNTTLKHVNIENNNLTLNGEDVSGVRELARALGTGRNRNVDLHYFNMNNCCLNEACGRELEFNMRENFTLIMLDIENNKNMNYKDVRKI
mmetsp:Transcript_24772/g.21975  ORF Transcript_24772/g.21975 Transcript_24772/m.21975 type:complete len:124 (-) Transcript_24772:351-722(-)